MDPSCHYFDSSHCFICGYDGRGDDRCRNCGDCEQQFYCDYCGESFDDISCEEEECINSYGYAMKMQAAARTIERFILSKKR
jgi:hypothetical protein